MRHFFAAALALAAVTAPAQAVVFTGTTVGGPTFNRPIENGTSAPTALSGIGTAVRYSLQPFTVSVSGSYTFLLNAVTPANWDTYLGLYQGSFSPTAPLSNALIYNDDLTAIGNSGFSYTLNAGTSYIALVTGFANTDAGSYTLSITGPGNVIGGAVPEPTAWALLIGGFALVGAAFRRRRIASVVTA